MKLYPRGLVLLIDDEPDILTGEQTILQSEGITNIHCISDPSLVLPYIKQHQIEVILLDLKMPGLSGQELLEDIAKLYPEIPVIVITGTNELEEAVSCMRLGAFDFMVKLVEKNRLISSVRKAIKHRQLLDENRKLKRYLTAPNLEHPKAFAGILTVNQQMRQLFAYAELVADTEEPVLITGETGVGKELFARAIHKAGNLTGPFLAVNVAGIDDLAFSDTLFGHKKGAFTGALESRTGLLEQAKGGTILLDEIGDLSAESQVKLLRLIDNGEYYTLGSDLKRKADVRIIAATNKELKSGKNEEGFRTDLYYRLNTHAFHVPPLRQRVDDIPLLINHFLSNPELPQQDEIAALLAGNR